MAITKAQQYKQMLRDGGVTEDIGFSIVKPSKDGRRPGYRFGDERDKPGFDRQRNKENFGGNPNREGPSKEQFQRQTSLPSTKPKAPPGRDPNKPFEPFTPSTKPKDKPKDEPDIIIPKKKPPKKTNFRELFRGLFPTTTSVINAINKSDVIRSLNAKRRQKYLDDLAEEDKEEYDRVMNQLGGLGLDIIEGPKKIGVGPPKTGFTDQFEMPQAPPGKLKTEFKTVDGVSSLGDPGVRDILGEKYDKSLKSLESPDGPGTGRNNEVIPIVVPTTTAPTTTTSDEDVDEIINRGLAARFAGSLFDFSGLADGGRVPAMSGGIMNTDVIGGFADGSMDQMGRQMYGLGKLVKSVTKGVKKIVKSPIGKAALIGAGFGLAGMGPFSALKGSSLGKFLVGTGLPTGSRGPANTGLLGKLLLKKGASGFSLANLSPMKTLGIVSALPLLFGTGEEEEEQDPYRGPSIDIPRIRNNPYAFMAPRFEGSQFAADGGRIGYDTAGAVMSEEDMKKLAKSPLYKGFKRMYGIDPQGARENKSYEGKLEQFEQLYKQGFQEGGKAEPVAKKTMPLIDMDGMEKDYRETGGFVEMGRMERADDVPARLSKNEFVFTADAVRNAGDGNIDKGAEVMYNMMKNLEAGGEVSEESQGLEGARKMFQTSQRLGEVI